MSSLASPPLFSAAATRARAGARDGRPSLKTEALRFSAAPALFAACCFAAGTLAARTVSHPPAFELVLLLLAAMLSGAASRAASRVVLLPLATVRLILGMVCSALQPGPSPQTALIGYGGRAPHAFEGRVARVGPVRLEETTVPFSAKIQEEYSQNLDLAVSSIGDAPGGAQRGAFGRRIAGAPHPGSAVQVAGGVRVTLYAPTEALLPSLACGASVRITLPVHEPDRFLDPGVWDSRAYMLGEGIAAVGSAKAGELTVLPGPAPGPPLARTAAFACRLHAIQQ